MRLSQTKTGIASPSSSSSAVSAVRCDTFTNVALPDLVLPAAHGGIPLMLCMGVVRCLFSREIAQIDIVIVRRLHGPAPLSLSAHTHTHALRESLGCQEAARKLCRSCPIIRFKSNRKTTRVLYHAAAAAHTLALRALIQFNAHQLTIMRPENNPAGRVRRTCAIISLACRTLSWRSDRAAFLRNDSAKNLGLTVAKSRGVSFAGARAA